MNPQIARADLGVRGGIGRCSNEQPSFSEIPLTGRSESSFLIVKYFCREDVTSDGTDETGR